MGVKIDKKDIDILWELFKNSRLPIVKIANKVSIPKETVKYRMERLVESGFLNKFHVIADAARFGLSFYEIYIKLQGVSPEYEIQCIEKLKAHPFVCWLISTSGRFSFICTFLVKNPAQFYDGYNYIRTIFGSYIKEVFINISIEGEQFDYPYFKNFKMPSIKTKGKVYSNAPSKLDKLDTQLLKILSEHCRTPIKAIARQLNSTEVTIRSRMKRLEKNGFIIQYSILLHPGRAGYFFNLMLLRLNGRSPELEDYLKKIPELFYFVKGAGFFDIKVEFYSESENRVHELEEEIYQKFAGIVSNIDILHVKKEHCVRYFVDA